ncbi:sugar phosphate nucleotidyltransferase [Solwaraspora sp. WMMD1047]|uniref:sugar phosphate nucleotidyltransferase n=1 Tax=Solwaraspora sp. WMMD1047 TaxID=3016102 RepID=UPI0024170A99|nr:sugar phosphate nucleotidyltransferase [Solwaraspora sp. WMMD1047]MDG4832989.1 sugar phosphate nucleotidyltransferase [Solwaraspora sp. WMMD1047]
MPTKAVIAVAGFGTRFFPVAKTLNKCMLPILTKPVVQYAVEDCVRAGITDIAIVTAPGQAGSQVRHYFTADPDTEAYFHDRGWDDKWRPAAHLQDLATFTFLEQPRDQRYGTAVPAMVARDFIAGEDFVLLAGDDLLLRADGGSDIADLVDRAWQAGVSAALAAATVDGTQAYRYGVLSTANRDADTHIFTGIVEKPRDWQKPTCFVNISRYYLPADITGYFDRLRPDPSTGEYQTTDVIEAYATDHETLVSPITGTYYDCGNINGWLAANNAAAGLADR